MSAVCELVSTLPDRIDAVVFDMDGTLLDTETLYKEVLFLVVRELGHEMTEEFHRDMIGYPRERNRAALRQRYGADFPLEAYAERCRAGMAERCRAGVPLKPGAQELLDRLRTIGMPAAVATSSHREDAVRHLQGAGLLDRFETVVSRDDVTQGKPHPETFLLAAERLGADPRHCLAIEDSHNGIRAAHAAGMHVIMVPDMLPPTDEMRALCRLVLDGLAGLEAMLRDDQPRVVVSRVMPEL